MNIERTIEFILENQARAEVRMEKAEIRAVERDRKVNLRLDALTKLIHQGMKTLAGTQVQLQEIAQSHKELAQSHKELAQSHKGLVQAQKETDRTLRAFIASSRNGKNRREGH